MDDHTYQIVQTLTQIFAVLINLLVIVVLTILKANVNAVSHSVNGNLKRMEDRLAQALANNLVLSKDLNTAKGLEKVLERSVEVHQDEVSDLKREAGKQNDNRDDI